MHTQAGLEPRKLNLGCGATYLENYVNLDWNSLTQVDVSHNLNELPYPFDDNSFDEILASHVLEHLDRPFDIMTEMHRILRPGGLLHIKVPHFSRGFTHAEHAHGFDVSFPKYFDPTFTRSGFFGVDFALEEMRLDWLASPHLLPYFGYGPASIACLKAINSVISTLANASPNICSRLWCVWVGGFEQIEFKMRCRK
jgi:SAM-dependent methyltransferase